MNFHSIFYPESIAIIGASAQPGSVGNDLTRNLAEQGYRGKIFPVNPRAEEVRGLKCYSRLNQIKEKIDLAVIAIPAPAVPAAMEEVAAEKIKAAIVISSGFKETGEVALEEKLKKICLDNDITLIGPNCLGVINPCFGLNATFSRKMPACGSVAFISQSGALCTAVIDYVEKMGIGFSKFLSLGNKAVVDETALLEYLADDENTKIIAMYFEELRDGAALIKAARRVTRGASPKPIIALKSGRTAAGAAASALHTGALAGDDAVYSALLEQAGIIRASRLSELFELVRAFDRDPLPAGNSIAVITNAGGAGVLAADEASANGLRLAKLSPAVSARLRKTLPPHAAIGNPIDVIGDGRADRYQAALEAALADKNVDSALVILTPQSMTEIEATADAIIAAKKAHSKPLVASFIGGPTVHGGVEKLRRAGVCVINFPEQAAKALAVLNRFREISLERTDEPFAFPDVNKQKARRLWRAAAPAGGGLLKEVDAYRILAAYGFSIPKCAAVKNAAEAEKSAGRVAGRGKLALKIISPDIIHKSDVGGVLLDVEPAQAGAAFEKIMKSAAKKARGARLDGVLLAEMAPPGGTEMILGCKRDARLGDVLMVGLGGVFVEVYKDVSFGVAPLGQGDARRMLGRLRAWPIIAGVRGRRALDAAALAECLGRLSRLAADLPMIKEIDINPLLILPRGKGALVLDARLIA